MNITIHRGIDQIGGCITEIESKNGTKILIDLGHNLPEGDKPTNDPFDQQENLESLLTGVSHIFYSHYHGDHLGFEGRVPSNITQHIGPLSLKMVKSLKNRISRAVSLPPDVVQDAKDSLKALNRFKPYSKKQPINCSDISVTPYPVSHSAVDAYMFVVECDGKRILHTGDFRDHGYRGEDMLNDIKTEVKDIDILITEGTMLTRGDKRMMTEEALQMEAKEYFRKYKYAFVLCSSMDADRLVSFVEASQKLDESRRVDADKYQVGQIIKIKKNLPKPYNELFAYEVTKNDQAEFSRMKRYGFTLFVRNSPSFDGLIESLRKQIDFTPDNTLFIYSQWEGYIDKNREKVYKQDLYDFTHRSYWHFEPLHTSGHASKDALRAVCEHFNPKVAIIPIHKEGKGTMSTLGLKVNCPIVESSTDIDDISITIL